MPNRRLMPTVSDTQKNTLYHTIKNDAGGDFSYYFLVVAASIIATLGLLLNSSPIIIGAMLISPIMKPIIGMSFSITTGNSKLFSQSIKSIIFGSLFAVVISVLIALIVPTRALTSEIMSRSQPTVIDLIIALASGAAGAYMLLNKNDLNVLPGVAIATALLPPLCVVGSGLALYNFNVAFGGFLLFIANLIAINLAAALVFKIVGFTTKDEITVKNEDGTFTLVTTKHNRLILSITALILISIPLTYFMYNTIVTEKTDKTIDTALKTVISTYDNVDLVNYTYSYSDNKYTVNTVVRSDKQLYGSDIIKMENYLERALSKPTVISMKIIFASDVNALTTPPPIDSGVTSSPDISPSTPTNTDTGSGPDVTPQIPPSTNTDKFIQYTIADKCNQIGAELINFSFSYSSDSATYTVNAKINGDASSVDSIKDAITTILEDNLNRKVILITENSAETPPAETPVLTPPVATDGIYSINPS